MYLEPVVSPRLNDAWIAASLQILSDLYPPFYVSLRWVCITSVSRLCMATVVILNNVKNCPKLVGIN